MNAFYRVIFAGRNQLFFLFMIVIGLSFSTGVILCNIGLMDGYDRLLKQGLRKSSADLEIHSDEGFYQNNTLFQEKLANVQGLESHSVAVQSKAFVVGKHAKGILLLGVNSEDHSRATGLVLPPLESNEIILGEILAKNLGIELGDELTLAFSRGNQNDESLPYLDRFVVVGFVTHGLHKKDERYGYLNLKRLQNIVAKEGLINVTFARVKGIDPQKISLEKIEKAQQELDDVMGAGYDSKAFWSSYKPLIEAVQIEKFSISVVLQIIIIVSIFNIVAFLLYLEQRKASDFFILRAMGLPASSLRKFWYSLVGTIWFFSCLGALFLVFFVETFILRLDWFRLPGKIYELNYLSLDLGFTETAVVFLSSLVWLVLIVGLILRRLSRTSISKGLKEKLV